MSYDKTYSDYDNVFGSEPEDILVRYINQIENTKPVLDIGSGEGRNSLYLANNDFTVDAIDTSIVAVEKLSEISKKNKLSICTFNNGYNDFIPVHNCYSAILIFGLIQILSYDEIEILIGKINEWTCAGALIFVTAFGEKDHGIKRYSKKWDHKKNSSFSDGKNNHRTFLSEAEILDLFSEFDVIYHKEGWGKEHHHGDGILEKHYMIEAVFKK